MAKQAQTMGSLLLAWAPGSLVYSTLAILTKLGKLEKIKNNKTINIKSCAFTGLWLNDVFGDLYLCYSSGTSQALKVCILPSMEVEGSLCKAGQI